MTDLFLPFTPKGKATELLAIKVKERLRIDVTDAIDPLAVLPLVPARLVEPRLLWDGMPEAARVLFGDSREQWSGVGLGQSPDDGAWLILLNPTHTRTRRKATLMEEIVHIVLDHPKTRLVRDGDSLEWKRSHSLAVEDEAFTVGAACILPYPSLFQAIRHANEGASSIANRLGVSLRYVEFRINRAGLYHVYTKRVPMSLRAASRYHR